MWIINRIIVLFMLAIPSTSLAINEIDLPRDADGWTIFTPSSDSRIMYVAADGNDTAAASTGVYTSANHPDWSNPFNPNGTIQPFATFTAAYAQVRVGYPDWVLFKRGEVFTLANQTYACIYPKNGRSATEPALIGSYGNSGTSPILKAGNQTVFWDINGLVWLAVSGLEFYAQKRDPNSPEFVDHSATGEGSGSGLFISGSIPGAVKGILVEGCKFRHFKSGGHYSCTVANSCEGVVHYRNVYYDQHAGPSTGHSAGLGGNGVNIQIVENIFDHNGWLDQAGTAGGAETEATMFSHNTYFSNLYDSLFEGNINMRSSSIGFKITGSLGAASIRNLSIENNLLYDNEVGIQLEDNYHTDNGGINYRVKDCSIKRNVITDMGKSRPTNRTLGWGLQLAAWDGGVVDGNYLIHQDSSAVNYNFGIMFYDESKDVSITNNIIYGLRYARGLVLNDAYGASLSTNMVFAGNKIQIPLHADYTIDAYYNPSGIWTFNNNSYYSDKLDGQRFKLAGANKTLSEWQVATGDSSTYGQVSFPAPARNLVGYMVAIGETPTEDAFIAKARAQDRYNWDTRFTADAVNDYIRAGFGMGQRRLFRNVRLHTEVEP